MAEQLQALGDSSQVTHTHTYRLWTPNLFDYYIPVCVSSKLPNTEQNPCVNPCLTILVDFLLFSLPRSVTQTGLELTMLPQLVLGEQKEPHVACEVWGGVQDSHSAASSEGPLM